MTEPTLVPDHLPETPAPSFPDLFPADSDTHRDTVAKVYALLQIARDARRPMVGRWDRCYRMLFNRYWSPDRARWLPTPQVPEIFPIIRSIVGFATDQRITHTVSSSMLPGMGWDDFYAQMADNLETVLNATFHTNCEEREWTSQIWDGFVYGVGLGKTCWEPDLTHGLGDAMTRRTNPYFIYPDPQATSERDASFFIELKVVSVDELDRRFPGAAKLFEHGSFFHDLDTPPNLVDLSASGRSRPSPNPSAIPPATTPTTPRSVRQGPKQLDLPGVTVVEAWVRETFFEEVTDQRSGEKVRLPYTRWRVIVVAGNRVLMDCPATDLWEHGGHPYSRFAPFDIGEFWGPSLVELLIPSQESINRILAALQQNAELTGNPVWKEPANVGTQRTPITARPGQRITGNSADLANMGYEHPPPPAPALVELLRYHLGRMEAISGVTALQKGQEPRGRSSQGTIESVQEAAFVSIRLAQRNLEYAMREAGMKKAALICEFYDRPRIVSIAGPGAEKSALALGAKPFRVPGTHGATPFSYNLLVDAGSRRHTAKQLMEDRAVQMFTLGLLTPTEALKAMDWPNAEKVGGEVEAQAAALAATEASKRDKARA